MSPAGLGAWCALLAAQIVAGIVNLLLLAPVWMQLVHLLLADLLWIALVLLSAAMLCCLHEPEKSSLSRVMAGDSYEALYAYHRFLEAYWEPVLAAPSRRRLHMVFHDTEPGWETYVERVGHCIEADVAITAVAAKEFAAIVILGGRAPEYLRNKRQPALAGA